MGRQSDRRQRQNHNRARNRSLPNGCGVSLLTAHPGFSRPAARVQFIHGLEGSPQGAKARLLAQHFTARTPAMDTRNFDACVSVQAEVAQTFRPDILVGSSFGGAVAVAMLQRGLWRGATLLLAQAALRQGLPAQLPAGARVWLVHGLRDELIDVEDSRTLAAAGDRELVRLIEVDDDHPLHATVQSGELVSILRELFAASRGSRPRRTTSIGDPEMGSPSG